MPLAACEWAILVVDATQGVEAQTLANVYLALENNLEILPVINKIDLPGARPEEIKAEIEDVIGIPAEDAIRACTLNPAAALGVQGEVGSIAPGKAADLVFVTDRFQVQRVLVAGKVVR